MNIKETYVKAKVVFDRGKQWMNYLNFLMIIFITASNIQNYPSLSFISGKWWILFIMLFAIVSVCLAGFLEFKLKTVNIEAGILGRKNPLTMEMYDNQKKIMKKLGIE